MWQDTPRDPKSPTTRHVGALLLCVLAFLTPDTRAADCDRFTTLIEEGRINDTLDELLESRTDKACSYYLAREYLRRGDAEEAVKWINFARLFASRDRDPRLYPLILYHMLLLDPYSAENDKDYPALDGFDPEQDYNELLGFGGDLIRKMAEEAKVAFVPEMRSFLKDPRSFPCPEKSEWAERLYLDWAEAEGICSKVKAYEMLREGSLQDLGMARRFLMQLEDMGVDTGRLERVFAEPEGTVPAGTSEGAIERATPAPEPAELSLESSEPPPEDILDLGKQDQDNEAETPNALAKEAIEMLSFVEIPNGFLRMGCTTGDTLCRGIERPVTTATITKPFRLAAYETTNAAYRKCVEAEVCARPERSKDFGDPAKDDHPVVYVNWESAQKFCAWLGGRLPTEAEWELAARGPVIGYKYPNGNDISHDEANFDGKRGLDRWQGTSPVGSFPPNRRDLYDMVGNVREWVSDVFGNYSGRPEKDPERTASGSLRVTRGGDWSQQDSELRTSARHPAGPLAEADTLGFRCLLPALQE